MWVTASVVVYQVCTGDFLHRIFLVGLGVDGTVIADGVDLLAFTSNLGDSVTLAVLELLNKLFHDIDKDNLQDESLAKPSMSTAREGFQLPRSQTDTASQQRSHGQCSHLQSEQL